MIIKFIFLGNIVNVPISVEKTTKNLPRFFNETHTIQIDLKRRISDTHSYMFETVRPKLVLEALNELIKSELYIKENIKINDNWITTNCKEIENFIVDEENNEILKDTGINANFEELTNNINPGGTETLIFDNNELIGNYDINLIILYRKLFKHIYLTDWLKTEYYNLNNYRHQNSTWTR
jgi:hypothetical protein